jgi:glycosyltransferase involved in cell wall biosynthesis
MATLPVSVVIPTYNRAHLVSRAIDSVLAALLPGDELIVVDDGSTDTTEQAVERYGDRIRYVRQAHAGAGRARNRGMEEAAHPLLAFLDSDDEWMPDGLTLGRRLLAARPDVLFTFTDFAVHRPQGDRHRNLAYWHQDPRSWDEILAPGLPYSSLAPLPPGRPDFPVHVGSLYAPLLRAPFVLAATVLVRRSGASAAFRFAEDLPTYEDWEAFARLAREGPAAYLDCETAWQWSHDGPRLTGADAFVRATTRLTLLRRVWGDDPDFLARERAAFDRVRRQQHLVRARWLIARGRMSDARAELAAAGDAPMSHRLAAALPGAVARGLWSARERLRASG